MSAPHRATGLPARTPLDFSIDSDTYRFPTLPTRTWLGALTLEPPGCWWQLIPGQLPAEQRQHLSARLLDRTDPLDIDDLESYATAVLEQVCGLWFWTAHHLAVIARSNWFALDGYFVSCGFDPYTQPIGRVLAGTYTWRVRQVQKDSELRQLNTELWGAGAAPAVLPSGRPRDAAPDGWDDQHEADAFEAALSNLSGRA